jgi:hypothetical protein
MEKAIYLTMAAKIMEERQAISQLEGSLGRNRWKKIGTLRPGQTDINVLG